MKCSNCGKFFTYVKYPRCPKCMRAEWRKQKNDRIGTRTGICPECGIEITEGKRYKYHPECKDAISMRKKKEIYSSGSAGNAPPPALPHRKITRCHAIRMNTKLKDEDFVNCSRCGRICYKNICPCQRAEERADGVLLSGIMI